jgi:hypothetical protein
MRNIVVICALACFGFNEVASAFGPVRKSGLTSGKFASVTITPSEVDIGIVRFPGLEKSGMPAKLEAHIVANCPHYVAVSFGGFALTRNGDSIPAENISVAVNGINVPVNGRHVPIASSFRPTSEEGVDIPIDVNFELKRGKYPFGKYKGTLAVLVTTRP